ncbi:SDR family oxidoreductase [Nocardia sp. NPDC046473]|uniref:SDR family oxidoreductase n=1 Tax=Nocardia sp. NPDC046473 TaxID=3155733 RepID=UPI0033F4C339
MTAAGSSLGLDGKVAAVTGASRGLGAAIASKLCESGCHVVVNYAHDTAAAESLVAALDGRKGTAVAVKADITGPDGVATVLEQARRRFGRLDVFVHNAASWHPMSAIDNEPDAIHADIAAAIDPLLRAAAPLMELMASGGRVIAVSSNGARAVLPHYVSLGLAKSALETLVRYLAVELAGNGIAVNAITTAKLDKGPETPGAELIPMLAARTPAGRLTVPADVADVVALLCAPEAAWIHGQVITVDGGFGLRA